LIIYSDIVEHIVSFRQEIEPEYNVLVKRIGRSIKEVVRIGRRETLHYLAEDEKDAEHILARKKCAYDKCA
jgi:predicted transcriptional regulator